MYTEEQIIKAEWKSPGEKSQRSIGEVFEAFRDFTRMVDYEYNIAIGTDSQMIGHIFQFISVISIHRVGKGGLYFYSKELVPRTKFPVGNQKMRMYDEVSRSIALALHMKEKTRFIPVVHIDASPAHKKTEFTSQFSEQLKGYVQSCGFDCMLKPESYVAHAIADRHTKKKSRKYQRQLRQEARKCKK